MPLAHHRSDNTSVCVGAITAWRHCRLPASASALCLYPLPSASASASGWAMVVTAMVNELRCLEVAGTYVIPIWANAIEVRSWASRVCKSRRPVTHHSGRNSMPTCCGSNGQCAKDATLVSGAFVASGKGGRRYNQVKPTRRSGGGLSDAASENQTWLTSPADKDTAPQVLF